MSCGFESFKPPKYPVLIREVSDPDRAEPAASLSRIERTTTFWESGDPRPALTGEVHVWRASLDSAAWPSPNGLPADERMRAKCFSQPLTRRRWVASRWALRSVLARYLDSEPPTIELRRGEHGKPALVDRSDRLRFNLSHSGDLMLIAVAEGHEVGVDVERIDPRRDPLRLADRTLAPAAAAAIRAAPANERSPAFHRAWARREAVAKCHGAGLHGSLPATPVSVVELDAGPGFAAALAVATPVAPDTRLLSLAAPALSLSAPLSR